MNFVTASQNAFQVFLKQFATDVEYRSNGEPPVTVMAAVKQGATAYYPPAVVIDGNQVTPWWQGAPPTAGTPNGFDVYTLAITKTGNAAFIVFASMSSWANGLGTQVLPAKMVPS